MTPRSRIVVGDNGVFSVDRALSAFNAQSPSQRSDGDCALS
jgi:hypothetical protein